MRGAVLYGPGDVRLIVAPTVEAVPGGPAVFDIHGGPGALDVMGMALEHCQVLEGGFVWLRYRFSWDRPTQQGRGVVQR
jgi:hypothetical protein